MKKIQKANKMVKSLISYTKAFGIIMAIKCCILPRINGKYVVLRHKAIKKYLNRNYLEALNLFLTDRNDKIISTSSDRITDVRPIWVCWFQGEENMPELVKCCYNSIKENAGQREVRLITFDNLSNYVEVSDIIWNKYKTGKITLTHLSDYLRVALLNKYGGLWMDATILSTRPLVDDINYEFFSIKEEPTSNIFISNYRWAGWMLGGRRNNVIFDALEYLLVEYHKKESFLLDFLLLDYLIDFLYDNIEAVHCQIDRVPFVQGPVYALEREMNRGINNMGIYFPASPINKLARQRRHDKETEAGEKTVYSEVLARYLHS